MRNEDRERAVIEIASRVVEDRMTRAMEGKNASILQVINDTVYHEKRRLKEAPANYPNRDADFVFWHNIQKRYPHADRRELKLILDEIVTRYAGEIAGNFNPEVYKLTSQVLPFGLAMLLNSVSPGRMLRDLPNPPSLQTNIIQTGKTQLFQKLGQLGTLVLVPTHLSNLDSPVVGWSIYKQGLPPFTYGAGLNLFSNPMLSFFMHNLGAYKVDRLKKAILYKDVLKEYATCSLEYGYHSLFFPGGTRIRSGKPERKLKKGLLGTSVQAYINRLKNNHPQPKLFIVPCTINYHLVLEAKSLIEDHLRREGKTRYIEDKESTDIRNVFRFASSAASLDANIRLVFGDPMDPFGNLVNEHGESLDRRGRVIDTARYVMRGDSIVDDPQRDFEYTRELSSRIVEQFSRYNMIMVTNLAAKACFNLLQRKNSTMDLYQLLHTGGNIDQLHLLEVYSEIDRLMLDLKRLEKNGELMLEPYLLEHDSDQILARALRFFGSYHNKRVIVRKGDRIKTEDIKLLYYYQNRLDGYELQQRSKSEVAFEG